MRLGAKSSQLPHREKYHIRSLTSLLDRELIPLPEQLLKRDIFNQQINYRTKKQYSHQRAISQQQLLRKTADQMKQKKSQILHSLRRTWHTNPPEEKVKLRTVGTHPHQTKSLEIKKVNQMKLLHNKNNNPLSPLERYNDIIDYETEKTQESVGLNFIPQKPSHKFLRKGTSINRQVVTNIMKLKLGKRNQLADINIQNQQIAKMIRLYKGCEQQVNSERFLKPKQNQFHKKQTSKVKQEDQLGSFCNKLIIDKSIIGWRENSEQNDDNYNQMNYPST